MSAILMVEDDASLSASLRELLLRQGFVVHVAQDGDSALAALNEYQIDVVLLDIMLPGEMNGIAVCRAIRSHASVPVIMLTGITDDVEKIVSLETGADHYVTKPFNPRVLLACIQSVLRRCRDDAGKKTAIAAGCEIFEFSGWKLNATTRTLLSADNRTVKLTAREFSLLQAFLEHPGRILDRDQLLQLTQYDPEAFDRSIDVLMSRLRSRIKQYDGNPEIFKTIRNGGYLLSCPVRRRTMNSEMWEKTIGHQTGQQEDQE